MHFQKKIIFIIGLKNDCKISEKELLKTFNCGLRNDTSIIPKKEKLIISLIFCKVIKQPIEEVGEILANKKITFFN